MSQAAQRSNNIQRKCTHRRLWRSFIRLRRAPTWKTAVSDARPDVVFYYCSRLWRNWTIEIYRWSNASYIPWIEYIRLLLGTFSSGVNDICQPISAYGDVRVSWGGKWNPRKTRVHTAVTAVTANRDMKNIRSGPDVQMTPWKRNLVYFPGISAGIRRNMSSFFGRITVFTLCFIDRSNITISTVNNDTS